MRPADGRRRTAGTILGEPEPAPEPTRGTTNTGVAHALRRRRVR